MSEWVVESSAVHVESVGDLGRGLGGWMIRHPAFPFVVRLESSRVFATLVQAACAYISRIRMHLPAPFNEAVAISASGPVSFTQASGSSQLVWLVDSGGDPRRSFRISRHRVSGVSKRAGSVTDETVVLLAYRGGGTCSRAARMGLRVVIHISMADEGQFTARISGMSAFFGPAQDPATSFSRERFRSTQDKRRAAAAMQSEVRRAGAMPQPLTSDRKPRKNRLEGELETLNAKRRVGKWMLDNGEVSVTAADRQSRDLSKRKAVSLNDKALASRDVSADEVDWEAIDAFRLGNQLFSCLRRFGLAPEEYFRFAEPSIRMYCDAGLHRGPGRDGSTVNAEVVWEDWETRAQHADGLSKKGRLEVRFSGSYLERDKHGQVKRRTVAADPHWNWHEYGHVLLAAATGDLEFPFVHSVGDALSAIFNDSGPEIDAPMPDSRGVTFPLTKSPRRRHDRRVDCGWGWNGSMYQRTSFFVEPGSGGQSGYWAEQILSSSLFRMYRALGGDSMDPAIRRAAADHSIYLIMRAVALAGPSEVVPMLTADQFVSALIDADIGTGAMDFGLGAGGLAHKVIRWAFQQQGLYSRVDGLPCNMPGGAEAVDIAFADRRGATYGALDASRDDWHAAASALDVRLDPRSRRMRLQMNLQNLGDHPAADVVVTFHAAPIPANGQVPKWGSGSWRELGTEVRVETIGPGESFSHDMTIDCSKGKRGMYAVIASASCPGDLSNTDPRSGLSCASHPVTMPWLVACDNNLALRVVEIPAFD